MLYTTEVLQTVASETVAVAGYGLRKFEVTDARLSRASMRSIWLAPEASRPAAELAAAAARARCWR